MKDSDVLDLRKNVLVSLLNFRQDVDTLKKELSAYQDPCGEKLVVLQRMHLLNILSKYSLGLLKTDDVTEWASLIDCRDDVGYEKGYEGKVATIINELAKPAIMSELNAQKLEEYFKVLSR